MKTTWRQELIPLVCIAAMIGAGAWSWSRVPDRLPIHWNAVGRVDGYGGKFVGLALIPLVSIGVYALFFALPALDPGKRNYENFASAYRAVRTGFLLFLGALYAATLVAAHGRNVNMTTVVMSALGVLFMVIGNAMGKIRPNHFVGIRTPWTLSSKQSWNKTHRLGGWLFMLQGIVFVATGFASPGLLILVVIGSPLITICVLVPYSYHAYANDPERISPAGVTPAHDDSMIDEIPTGRN